MKKIIYSLVFTAGVSLGCGGPGITIVPSSTPIKHSVIITSSGASVDTGIDAGGDTYNYPPRKSDKELLNECLSKCVETDERRLAIYKEIKTLREQIKLDGASGKCKTTGTRFQGRPDIVNQSPLDINTHNRIVENEFTGKLEYLEGRSHVVTVDPKWRLRFPKGTCSDSLTRGVDHDSGHDRGQDRSQDNVSCCSAEQRSCFSLTNPLDCTYEQKYQEVVSKWMGAGSDGYPPWTSQKQCVMLRDTMGYERIWQDPEVCDRWVVSNGPT